MSTTIRPLELPDNTWAARLADAIHIMDGARDAYSITIQVTDPQADEPTAHVRIWARDTRDAQDAAQAFNAGVDATATSDRTLVYARHYTDGPMVEIITGRPAQAPAAVVKAVA